MQWTLDNTYKIFFPKTILNVIFDQILKQTCQYHMLWKTVLSGIENNLQIINSY